MAAGVGYGLSMSLAYEAFDWSQKLAQPLNLWARAVRTGFTTLPGAGPVVATAELLEAATRAYERPTFGLTTTTCDGDAVRVEERTVLETPFCRLVRFERAAARPLDPKVLVAAPLSGHYATLVRDTVRELLPDHDVYVTDWVDARLVPVSEGGFGLHDYIDLVVKLLGVLGPDVHVIAVCQPCVPVLAAVATMAAADDPHQPATMTLMSGPIDARLSPTKVDDFATERPLEWLEATVIHGVPSSFPGRGRRVYAGAIQLRAFMSLDLPRHAVAHYRHWWDVALQNDVAAEKHRAFYDEYFAVMDLPAEFYLETVSEVFQRFTLAQGTMVHRGAPVRPDAIRRTALLTVEGAKDDITGLGQTRAAHDLCSGLPIGRKRHHLQPDVGHYGTFSGRGWREGIAPVVRAFIRQHD